MSLPSIHAFDASLAAEYGIEEAVFMRQFHSWISMNHANQKNQHEGRTWVYQSAAAYVLAFPYWDGKALEKIVGRLIKKDVLIERDVPGRDGEKWYAFADESKWIEGVEPMATGPSQCRVFIAAWVRQYKEAFGDSYAQVGGADAKAAKVLLKATGLPAAELMTIAEQAWRKTGRDFWACENQSKTIRGFASSWMRIKQELARNGNGHRVESREVEEVISVRML